MFAIMMDPHFKSLWVMKDCMGCGDVIHLVIEYDVRVAIFVLIKKKSND
jgi:hypothetical protein